MSPAHLHVLLSMDVHREWYRLRERERDALVVKSCLRWWALKRVSASVGQEPRFRLTECIEDTRIIECSCT